MESIANETFKTVDTRYDESDAMDPGGIVATLPAVARKRTRKAKDGGAGSGLKAQGGESGGGIYLLVDADKKATPVEPENLRSAIARTWMDSTLTLYKAVPVNAEYIVK